ncbi:MAG: universal stress protein [Planctomycetales bacterium]|nr:universal stress protein [Planctomycetales bacterium]MBN8625127.1 universal stress protein [Planctomycetota bacterium]
MNTRKILYAADFSRTGAAALEHAADLATKYDATLLVTHVAEPPVVYAEGMYYFGVPAPDREALTTMLRNIRPADTRVKCEYHLLEGDPATALTDFARDKKVDFIVLSSHGRTGLSRLVMGSVAELVMRHAPCPVLVVKPTAPAAKPELVKG